LVLLRFQVEEGLSFVYRPEFRSLAATLFDENSPLYKHDDLRKKLIDTTKLASKDRTVQLNFVDFFDKLIYGARDGGNETISHFASKALLADSSLLTAVWSAVVARPLQPRRALTLIEDRKKLIEMGIADES